MCLITDPLQSCLLFEGNLSRLAWGPSLNKNIKGFCGFGAGFDSRQWLNIIFLYDTYLRSRLILSFLKSFPLKGFWDHIYWFLPSSSLPLGLLGNLHNLAIGLYSFLYLYTPSPLRTSYLDESGGCVYCSGAWSKATSADTVVNITRLVAMQLRNECLLYDVTGVIIDWVFKDFSERY